MTVQGVLFDVGGPIDTEVARERLIDRHIREAFADAGHPVDDATFAAAVRRAVDAFAPGTYRAMVWYLSGQDADLAERVYSVFRGRAGARQIFEVRAGIREALARLHERGLRLGLATNAPGSPRTILACYDEHGIGRYFHDREDDDAPGLSKPDVRLFLRACHRLGVAPADCVMVGDRIDNDIVPARTLGMPTVLLRTGRHRDQQPRSWDERPDVEVHDVPALEQAIYLLLQLEPPHPDAG